MGENETEAEKRAMRHYVGYAEIPVALVGSVANLFVLCLTLLFLRYAFDAVLTRTFCLFFYVSSYLSMIASSLSLLALNIDKFVQLARPLHYPSLVTVASVRLAIVAIWVLALALTLIFIFAGTAYEGACIFRPRSGGMYVSVFVICFIVPIASSAILSVGVAVIVASFRARTKVSVAKNTNVSCLKRFRSIIFVFTTTLWSFLTCIPYRIFYLFIYFNHYDNPRLIFALFLFLTLNPAGNPFITILTQRQYSQVLRVIWKGKLKSAEARVSVTVGSSNPPIAPPQSLDVASLQCLSH